ELLAMAAARPVTIADGHHRYETALRYCENAGEAGGAGYVLALMFEANTGALELRPWHRVLRAVGDSLADLADEWFAVTPFATPQELFTALHAHHDERGVFGLWTPRGGALLVAKPTNVAAVLADGGSETFRWLDVSVLSATLSRMIGTTPEQLAAEDRLSYSDDASGAVEDVRAGRADAAFLLRPTPIADVLAVAAAGEFMPAKSTLFYPKAATGLVFNPLRD
ncbi:MAG TPA: DUF1015 family protein, partial [Candidatus Limnocylindrales bacterium]|nr:DUF1015 family protein [Candidatus Limnocylindrales bacterium]